jgi:hypothetical protein
VDESKQAMDINTYILNSMGWWDHLYRCGMCGFVTISYHVLIAHEYSKHTIREVYEHYGI